MEKEIKIKSIDPVGFGAFTAILYGLIGLLYGFIFLLIASIGITFTNGFGGSTNFGSLTAGIGVLGIVIFPIIFAIMGFIGGLIGALIVNLTFAIIKGLKIKIEE